MKLWWRDAQKAHLLSPVSGPTDIRPHLVMDLICPTPLPTTRTNALWAQQKLRGEASGLNLQT